MAITSHANLRSAVVNWTENTATEFTDELDNMITNAEQRVQRDCDLNAFIFIATGSLTSAAEIFAKPTDLETVRYFSVLSTDTARRHGGLDFKHVSYVREVHPTPANGGQPQYYADWGTSAWLLAPAPDNNYGYEISYKALATSITVATAGTWLTQHVPDILFHACMVEAYKFMKDAESMAAWEAEYQNRIGPLRVQEIAGGRNQERDRGDK